MCLALLIGSGLIIYKAFIYTSQEAKEIQKISREICRYSLPKAFKPEGAINMFFVRAAMLSNKNKDPFLLARAAIIEYDSGDQNELVMQQVKNKLIAKALEKVTITGTQTNILVSVTTPSGTQVSRRQTIITVKETGTPLIIYEGFFLHQDKLIHGMFGSFDPKMNIVGLDFVDSLIPPADTNKKN
jgi:hypothetical protein